MAQVHVATDAAKHSLSRRGVKMLQEDASSARRETVTRRHLGASKAPTDSEQGKIIIIIVVVVVVVVVVDSSSSSWWSWFFGLRTN